jgi:23S rRNA G2069 N7-methylase RlmK/C1962 C5-methylase RlmI
MLYCQSYHTLERDLLQSDQRAGSKVLSVVLIALRGEKLHRSQKVYLLIQLVMYRTIIRLTIMAGVICRKSVTSLLTGQRVSRVVNPVMQSTRLMSFLGDKTPKVILEKGKARLFQDGNPLIYGGAVKEVVGDPQAGDEVIVNDHMGNPLGRGVFNPYSQYRVRMMARTYESLYELPFEDLIKKRIEQAIAVRSAITLPSSENSVYRLINGEGDRLGGLVVDVLGTTIVAQSSAYWVERHKKSIEAAILSTIKSQKLVWRRAEGRLKQDGYTGDLADIVIDSETALEGTGTGIDTETETADLIVVENGIKYVVCPEDGQKTGFYCDQRDNRMMIRGISKGKTVLDTFCYSGGFSVNAAAGEEHSARIVEC